MTRIKAVILEGADPAAIAAIQAELASQDETVVFAPPSIAEIMQRVAFETGLRPTEIIGPCRGGPIFRARCAVSLLAKMLTTRSLGQIGQVLGARDHTTIINQLRRADEFMVTDPAFRLLLERVVGHFEQEERT